LLFTVFADPYLKAIFSIHSLRMSLLEYKMAGIYYVKCTQKQFVLNIMLCKAEGGYVSD
jgi:hypothetical protein